MRKLTPEAVIATVELEQLILDYFQDVDCNDAHGAPDFYSEDCTFDAAKHSYRGRDGIRQFYALVHASSGGIRTTRHTVTNLRVVVKDADHATASFNILTYRGDTAPPVTDLVGPKIISDNELDFRREADGQWLITALRGRPIFVSAELAGGLLPAKA